MAEEYNFEQQEAKEKSIKIKMTDKEVLEGYLKLKDKGLTVPQIIKTLGVHDGGRLRQALRKAGYPESSIKQELYMTKRNKTKGSKIWR